MLGVTSVLASGAPRLEFRVARSAAILAMAASDEAPRVQAWPAKFELAKLWEADGLIRATWRVNKFKLLCWVKPTLVGVASLRALALNKKAVELALLTWTSFATMPKSPPVDWLKQEAGHWMYIN